MVESGVGEGCGGESGVVEGVYTWEFE